MSQYQSISISLDDNQHWKVPLSYKDEEDSGSNLAPTTEICIESTPNTKITPKRTLHVYPIEDYYTSKGECDALLQSTKDPSNIRTKTKNNTWPLSFILMTTLCLGFSVGFSFGYYTSESRYFSSKNRYQQHKNEMPLNPLKNNLYENNDAKKVFQFMDEFLFRDSPLLTSNGGEQQQRKDPLLRLPFQQPTVKKPIVYLSNVDAYSYLLDTSTMIPTISQYSNDFFLISSGLDSQINQAYCGVASVVAILNSLRFIKTAEEDDGVDVPVDPNFDPYPYATQTDVFNNCTKQTVISHTGGGPGMDGLLTPPYGLNMDQVSKLLQCHLQSTKTYDWKVSIQYVDNTHQTVGKMRFDLKNALADPNSRVLVNYDRETVGQMGGGHWSPVGSYSDKQDAFLILDVAKYRYPPAWIPSDRLFDAMSTQDECGEWNYPNGQDVLSQEERFAHTQVAYATSETKLGCQSRLRGYIIVSRS